MKNSSLRLVYSSKHVVFPSGGNICPQCAGRGRFDGRVCSACDGLGKLVSIAEGNQNERNTESI
jgi:hypothetical protein